MKVEKWTLRNARATMRKIISQCLIRSSLILEIVGALIFIYFCHYVNNNKQKTIQIPTSVWSLRKNVSQQIRYHLRQNDEMLEEIEIRKPRSFPMPNGSHMHSESEFILGFTNYGLNIMTSRNVGIKREVPDTRNKMCRRKVYPANLPSASIIICFHNEEINALFRTLYSVINLSPSHLLEEIILVDDMSEFDDLKEELDRRLEDFRGVLKLIRSKRREGLIRARLLGAAHASGDVLVFLDSHCEVNRGWLEPLLSVIAKDSSTVVCPVIDVIDEFTMEYKPSPIVRGAFDWALKFKWDKVFSYEMDGPEGPTSPIRSPAMAGGIFAIDRRYFKKIGQYDKDMNLWGGENLEISLRIWMCGGQLLILPCSRVGHINRKTIKNNMTLIQAISRNYLRLVHTWLDEYKEEVFLRRPGLRTMSFGNISERIELKKRLGCKSFQWYLDTVFPELEASVGKMKEKSFH